jgi:hypothetical protein
VTTEPYVPPEGLAKTREEFIARVQLEEQTEEEIKPVVHRRCGDCLAFKTHFCPFWLSGKNEVALRTTDYACSDWAPGPRPERRQRFNWATVVTNL